MTPKRPKGQSALVTEQMRLWAAEFMEQLRIYSLKPDMTPDVRTAMAGLEAEKIFPLEEWERAEIKDICDRKRLADLVQGRI